MFEFAKRLLEENILCDNCLGRQFALLGYGLANSERGKIIKEGLVLELYEKLQTEEDNLVIIKNIAKSGNELALRSLKRKISDYSHQDNFVCELCDGIFSNREKYSDEVLEKLSKEDYQTFLIGAKIPISYLEKEDTLRAKYSISTGESIKEEFTREVGKIILKRTQKTPDLNLPDVTVIINLEKNKIILEKRSLFIFGRYRKFIRTIPQTKWPCYDCNAKGCEKCNFTGKRYQESIEELIANPIHKFTGGTGSRFHGAGREDIDALMLGNGRPFVLEIKNPDNRKVDLKKLEKTVNRKAKGKVKISNLIFSDKRKVKEIKGLSTKTRKTYRAKILLENQVSDDLIDKISQELKGLVIKQRTPQRVSHRRADLVRDRRVFDISVRRLANLEIEAEITGEGGLYIKELISGDDGRTNPSFTSILGTNTKCIQLDVIYFHTVNE